MTRKKAPAQVSGSERKGRPFKKGQSGNPGGQPKWVSAIRDELEVCATKGSALLLKVIEGEPVPVVVGMPEDTLVDEDGQERRRTILVTPELKDRLKAIELALKYTVPAPKQEFELTGKDGGLVKVTKEVTEAEVLALWKAHEKS